MKKLISVLLLALASISHAADGTWSFNGSGNWSDTTKWQSGIVADGDDSTATLANTITINNTAITNDTPRTIGNLITLDTGQNYRIVGTNILTFNRSIGLPYVSSLSGRVLTILCPVTLAAGLQKLGAGNVTFGSNIVVTASQTWDIQAGSSPAMTVSAGPQINIGANNLVISNAATVFIGNLGSATPMLYGSGNLTKTGSGLVQLAGSNGPTHTGATEILGGSIVFSSVSTPIGGGNLLLNGGIFSLYYGGSLTRQLGIGNNQIQVYGSSGVGGQGASNSSFSFGTSIIWGALGEGSATGYFNPTVFELGEKFTPNNARVSFGSNINLNGSRRTINANRGLSLTTGNISTLSGNITGLGPLVKTGTGTLALTSLSNTYTGGTELNGGVLQITQETSIGADGSVITVDAGAELQHLTAISTPYSTARRRTGRGTYVRSGTGVLTYTGINTISAIVVSNAPIVLAVEGAFSGDRVTLFGTSSATISAANVIGDKTAVYVATGSGGAIVPTIYFSTPGMVETISELYIDGVPQPAGTYGSTGSGATYPDDNVFADANGVIRVLGVQATVVGGKAIVIGGKLLDGKHH